ncbi:hypothetical protein [Absidia glauca]|uniref:Hyaluronan/mRNA-binding protein domain-containing protein n=1 Tax=Absidia glauca TaxID=4829 RepID=A0A163J668_ABSGL|nr:hypothetical protein [Absidia glauca]
MSAFSKNLFSLLSEDGEVRPQPAPVKEDVKPVEQPKNDKRSPKSAGVPLVSRNDSEKKEKQGWGHPETAEAEAASDSVNPKDPAAAEEPVTPTEPEEVVKTLDEYLAEKANKNLKVTLPEARKANEGADDAKWKDAVAFAKVEEPEYLPAKNGARRGGRQSNGANVNLQDDSAFPSLGAASA